MLVAREKKNPRRCTTNWNFNICLLHFKALFHSHDQNLKKIKEKIMCGLGALFLSGSSRVFLNMEDKDHMFHIGILLFRIDQPKEQGIDRGEEEHKERCLLDEVIHKGRRIFLDSFKRLNLIIRPSIIGRVVVL